jgi:hypothetical protein
MRVVSSAFFGVHQQYLPAEAIPVVSPNPHPIIVLLRDDVMPLISSD